MSKASFNTSILYAALALVISINIFIEVAKHRKDKQCKIFSHDAVIECLENNDKNCKIRGLEAYSECRRD